MDSATFTLFTVVTVWIPAIFGTKHLTILRAIILFLVPTMNKIGSSVHCLHTLLCVVCISVTLQNF